MQPHCKKAVSNCTGCVFKMLHFSERKLCLNQLVMCVVCYTIAGLKPAKRKWCSICCFNYKFYKTVTRCFRKKFYWPEIRNVRCCNLQLFPSEMYLFCININRQWTHRKHEHWTNCLHFKICKIWNIFRIKITER